MVRMPAEPMLAQPVDIFTLPTGWAAEPKWDGSPDASGVSHSIT